MEDQAPNVDEDKGVKALASFYSSYVWNRLVAFFPSNTKFIGKISGLYRQTARTTRKPCFPLPLPSNSPDSSLFVTEPSRLYDVLEDIIQHLIANLHNVQKNLQFWQSRAEGSNARKLYFMIFERGPLAFIDGTVYFLREFGEGSTIQRFYQSASAHISERIAALSTIRDALATSLAEVYMEVNKCGEELVKDPEKSLPSLLASINGMFSNLEASIGHLHAIHQTSSVDGSYSFPLLLEELPEVNGGSQWTDCEMRDAINMVYKNLETLDSYVSLLVAKHQKPRKVNQYWIRYTCGAVGLSVCSLWLLRHSSLMGSSDIDNWIQEARDSVVNFFSDHVEQPLLSIRDELFETFRKRQKGVMEAEEVQLTANSLRRMLLAFSEQTKGQKFPENASDQEMLEIVMTRYEKELTHPIQNLLSGELARALLIQVQKLKLDIETAMLELDQILRANEINFAILAALPAFFISLILLMVARAWLKRVRKHMCRYTSALLFQGWQPQLEMLYMISTLIEDTRAEGRGRIARRQRRLLLAEVERRIMQYQNYIDQGLEKESISMYGLALYSLDRLFHAVERHAKATGEWQCLRQDIMDLGKPGLPTTYKLAVTSRMEQLYECLLPSFKRQ